MKRIMLRTALFIAMFFSGVTVFAQNGDETMAKKMTDKLKDRLPLADSVQYQKMYNLNLKYIDLQRDAVQGSGGRIEKFRAMKELQNKKSQEAKAMLSKDQYKNYQAVVAEMRQEMMEKLHQHKNGGNQ